MSVCHHSPTSTFCNQCFVAANAAQARPVDLSRVVGYRVRIGSSWIFVHPSDVELVTETP